MTAKLVFRTSPEPQSYQAGAEFESALGGLPCSEVYHSYVRWCGQNGYRPLNTANFGKEVKRALPGVEKQQKRYEGRRQWIYCGIVVREDSEVANEFIQV